MSTHEQPKAPIAAMARIKNSLSPDESVQWTGRGDSKWHQPVIFLRGVCAAFVGFLILGLAQSQGLLAVAIASIGTLVFLYRSQLLRTRFQGAVVHVVSNKQLFSCSQRGSLRSLNLANVRGLIRKSKVDGAGSLTIIHSNGIDPNGRWIKNADIWFGLSDAQGAEAAILHVLEVELP